MLAKPFSEEYRQRIYTPRITLGLFVDQSHERGSKLSGCRRTGRERGVSQGEKPCGLNNGPCCKARQRLPPALLTELCDATGRRLVKAQPSSWRWRGRKIKLIDGTTMSMPDTAANQRAYPQVSQHKARLGFPIARMVGILSKEIAAHLLAYKLVRSVMAQAAVLTALLPHQLRFKGALQQRRAFERSLRHGKCAFVGQALDPLLIGIGQLRPPVRPGRIEPRALKRRGKNLPFLTRPRGEERAHLMALRQQLIRTPMA